LDVDGPGKSVREADWVDASPALRALDAPSRSALMRGAQQVRLPRGTVAYCPGQRCEHFILVLDGAIRVQMLSETGREFVLYRVTAGESCILTTSCLLGGADYPAEAIAETEVHALMIPRTAFRACIDSSPALRDFVFDGFGRRLTDLLSVVEEIAFRRLDLRLARMLIERTDPDCCVRLSHQALAKELGTVREVVSRQLKDFERRRWVKLHRGWIEVLDAAALRRMIGG
jgi:cAMP-binding proteins - catabolite gene activator and regulatory subunit of cAMP-dependent protein kinases